jgi:hypothetical protein
MVHSSRAILVIFSCIFAASCNRQRRDVDTSDSMVQSRPGELRASPFMAPGIECPPTRSAEEADIPGDEQVVGVVVNGKARAYLLSAMVSPMRHIVNDLIQDTPVSVTFCNHNGCVRVFTDDTRGKPLKISLMGFADGMLIRVGDRNYEQESGQLYHSDSADVIPFAPFPFEVVTWNDWKKAHPNTDIFTGLALTPGVNAKLKPNGS